MTVFHFKEDGIYKDGEKISRPILDDPPPFHDEPPIRRPTKLFYLCAFAVVAILIRWLLNAMGQ